MSRASPSRAKLLLSSEVSFADIKSNTGDASDIPGDLRAKGRREPPLGLTTNTPGWGGKPPFVRVVPVSGRKYVQVVQYFPASNGVRVLESFGPEDPESLLKAHLWKASLESLVNMRSYAKDSKKAALAVYGQLLGAGLVERVLEQNP